MLNLKAIINNTNQKMVLSKGQRVILLLVKIFREYKILKNGENYKCLEEIF